MPSRLIEWPVAGALAGWAAARLAGADRLRRTESWAVPALSFTPQAAAAAWAAACLLRRSDAAVTAAVAAAVLTGTVGRRAVRHRAAPADGPVLRVMTANLLAGRASAQAVIDLVRDRRADVLFVQELTRDAAARLQGAGLSGLLPHRMTQPETRHTMSGIYARYPLHTGTPVPADSAIRCTARLDVPGGPVVELTCVHTAPPKPPWSRGATARWRRQLAGLPVAGSEPCILAGDFNATLDHARFREVLDRGYVDAASQAGQGLTLTWGPRPGRHPTLLAIDHVLTGPRCAVITTSAHRLPGSDHRALYAELRLPL